MYNCPTFFLFWKSLDDMLYWTNLYRTVADNELHFFTISNLNYTVFVSLAHIPTTWNKLSEEEDNDLHQTNIGLAAKQHRNLVLMGDFNYPNIQWGSRRTDKVGAKFLELIDDCYLHQHVTEPTRYGNILDLVFSSEADMIEDVDVREPAVNSDHCTIHFKLVVRRHAKNNPDRQTRDYNRGESEGIYMQ